MDFSNPGGLRMLLYVPEALPTSAPLVVLLHGSFQNARDFAGSSGWLALAKRFGFGLLCPQQSVFNNVSRAFNWFEPHDVGREGGEAESIQQMVAQAIALHDFDPGRTFVTGLSAGGAMVSVMLATYPDVFAGGAVIAGLPYGAATNAWEAVLMMERSGWETDEALGDKVRAASPGRTNWPPISIWHGEQDQTVTPAAGEDLVRQWKNVHRLQDGADEEKTNEGRAYQVWRSPSAQSRVEYHRIRGMSHGAPIRTIGPTAFGRSGPHSIDMDISSSYEIAQSWGVLAQRL